MRVCERVFSVGFPQKTGWPGLWRGGIGGYNLHSPPTVAHQPRAGCIRLVPVLSLNESINDVWHITYMHMVLVKLMEMYIKRDIVKIIWHFLDYREVPKETVVLIISELYI